MDTITDQKQLSLDKEVIGEFSTQEAATLANSLLQAAGLSSDQSSFETSEIAADPTFKQVKTQSNAKNGAVFGGLFGAIVGLLACVIQSQVTGSPIWPTNPVLSAFAVSLAFSVVGSICFSLIGVITVSELSNDPLPDNPRVPSHKYLVTVQGNEEQIKQAVQIIRDNSGQV